MRLRLPDRDKTRDSGPPTQNPPPSHQSPPPSGPPSSPSAAVLRTAEGRDLLLLSSATCQHQRKPTRALALQQAQHPCLLPARIPSPHPFRAANQQLAVASHRSQCAITGPAPTSTQATAPSTLPVINPPAFQPPLQNSRPCCPLLAHPSTAHRKRNFHLAKPTAAAPRTSSISYQTLGHLLPCAPLTTASLLLLPSRTRAHLLQRSNAASHSSTPRSSASPPSFPLR